MNIIKLKVDSELMNKQTTQIPFNWIIKVSIANIVSVAITCIKFELMWQDTNHTSSRNVESI